MWRHRYGKGLLNKTEGINEEKTTSLLKFKLLEGIGEGLSADVGLVQGQEDNNNKNNNNG